MKNKSIYQFMWRVTSLHVITYFFIGAAAFFIFDYENEFLTEPLASLMKPTDSIWVMLGPMLNISRGILFAIVLWPFRNIFLGSENGWLKLWGLFLGLAILGTCGPSPGSIEGIIYTKLPIVQQLLGLVEIVAQTLLFCLLLIYWYSSEPKHLNKILISLFCLISVMLILGSVAR